MKEIQTQMKRIFLVHLLLAKKKQFLNFKTLLLRFKKLVCEATQLIQHTVVNYSSLQQVRSMIRKNNPEDWGEGGNHYQVLNQIAIWDLFVKKAI